MVWKGHLATNNKGMLEINKNVLSEIFDCIPCKDITNTGGANAGRQSSPGALRGGTLSKFVFSPNSVATRKGFLRSQLRPGVQSRWSAAAPAFFL